MRSYEHIHGYSLLFSYIVEENAPLIWLLYLGVSDGSGYLSLSIYAPTVTSTSTAIKLVYYVQQPAMDERGRGLSFHKKKLHDFKKFKR